MRNGEFASCGDDWGGSNFDFPSETPTSLKEVELLLVEDKPDSNCCCCCSCWCRLEFIKDQIVTWEMKQSGISTQNYHRQKY